MTDTLCTFGDGRDEALVAFLYDEPDGNGSEDSRFAAHLQTCARCQSDLAALRGVRTQLARWSPPEVDLQSTLTSPNSTPWWRQVPAWAQVAAALLVLGVSAGIANLDVRYDRNGLTVRTGWSDRTGRSGASDGAVAGARADGAQPWKADIAALESQLTNQMRALQTTAPAAPAQVRTVSASDADINARVRALVAESEKRQQRELALRIAELARDVNAQRQADMVKIDRTLGVVQNNVGIEVMKTRQQMNQMDLIYRASQQK